MANSLDDEGHGTATTSDEHNNELAERTAVSPAPTTTDASMGHGRDTPSPADATTLNEPSSMVAMPPADQQSHAMHLPIRKRMTADVLTPKPLKKQFSMPERQDIVREMIPTLQGAMPALTSPTETTSTPTTTLPPAPTARPDGPDEAFDSGETTETDEETELRRTNARDLSAVGLPKKHSFIVQSTSETPPSIPPPSIPPKEPTAIPPSSQHIGTWIKTEQPASTTRPPPWGEDEDEDIDIDIDIVNIASGRASPILSTPPEPIVKKAKRGRPPLPKPSGEASTKGKKKTQRAQESASSDRGQHVQDKLYCVCQKPYDAPRFMIACDSCNQWFHGDCIGIGEREGAFIDQYYCDQCNQEKSTTWKPKCANPACSKPAQISHQGYVSKYCSDVCGLQVARARLKLAEMRREAAGYHDPPVAELVLARQKWSRLHSQADQEDRARLVALREKRKEAKKRLQAVQQKRAFFERLPAQEDLCGFDSRLLWPDDAWQHVEEVKVDDAGRVQLVLDGIETPPVDDVCQHGKKKCKHTNWRGLLDVAIEQERAEQIRVLTRLYEERTRIKERLNQRRDTNAVASSMANVTLAFDDISGTKKIT